ncbi:hypothetical protein GHT06_018694 [Daphnia sinensis]|uniref:Uncharacterized protein n=1 Tax=Daphnia sinensis TaxID=1820382 RepID=A0AAD5L4Y0_9CRUS|nr:hypothetical protein GHT06_018694 [Daphnia sinensis]
MSNKNVTEAFIHFVKSLPKKLPTKPVSGTVSTWMHHKNKQYEDIVGLSEVKAAQHRVLQSENKFIKSQEDRRDVQRKLSFVQQKLHELHMELDRVPRGDDKYLALITQEHSVMKEEKYLKEEVQQLEKEERENFAILSNNLRDSHEKERAQAEKTKYWSIIGSVLGTIVGVFGTTVNNRLKMKELRDLVESTTKNNQLLTDTEELSKQISLAIQQNSRASLEDKLQDFPEGKWKELKDSLLQVIQHECDSQKNVILQLSRQLETSLSPVDVNIGAVTKPSFVSQRDVETFFDQHTKHSNRLFAITVILIPTCTWALCKLFNM